MSHVYTASDDAILTIEDAAQHIKELENRLKEFEEKYIELQKFIYALGQMYYLHIKTAVDLNARVDAAMAGEVDWNDGPMNPEHLQHGQ